MKTRFLSILILFALACPLLAQETRTEPKHLKFKAVPFTEVQIAHSPFVNENASIWGKRLETNRKVSIPHNYEWCEKTGRFTNFAKAARLMNGKFEGIYFNDSDVYKLLEGTAYSLRVHPDPELEKRADAVIDWIAAAQLPNGYLNTYYQLVEPEKVWTDIVRHELYCCGHLIEAAVAYKRATGKDKLLNVAEKFVDHIIEVFGPEKKTKFEVPGHEEIELALVKLYELTDKEKYLKLAEQFLDVRGDQSKRGDKIHGPYDQDHLPIREQSEIVGHAVRAVYLYAGVADVAAYTGDEGYIQAMDRLWNDVVNKKMYITGGIGARHAGEAFGDAFELPNQSAYCETCAAIGLVFWAHRMNLLHGEAKYADVVERAMYNGVLAGIGADGKSFFYVNPLSSRGNHHRQPFYDCACCPTNVVRFVPSIPGYVYATDETGIVVNQFIPGDATIKLPDAEVTLKMRSLYPWDGTIKFSGTVKRLNPENKDLIGLKLRVPEWCHYPDKLPEIQLRPTGKSEENYIPYKFEKGYVVTTIRSEPEFSFEYKIPFTYRRIVAHPNVEADRGRVALQKGPIVYCLEEADNPGLRERTMIKKDVVWFEDVEGTLGGEVSATLPDYCAIMKWKSSTGETLTAIPYYAWDHREPGRMDVWIRQEGLPRELKGEVGPDSPLWKLPSGEPRLYQPLPDDKDAFRRGEKLPYRLLVDPATLPQIENSAEVSASHCNGSDSVEAVLEEQEPQNSGDQSISRHTFWPHRGTSEWLEYSFDAPEKLSKCSVYWFDDEGQGQCRVPKSWKILYLKGDQWLPVETESDYPIVRDAPTAVEFTPVETTALKLEVQLQESFSGGVLRWKLN